jgi:hypothetical protein
MQYIGNTDIAMKYCNRFPLLLLAIYCSKPLCITNKHVEQLTLPKCWICGEDETDKSECLRRD